MNGLGKEIAVLLHAFGIGEQPIVTPDCNGEGLYLPPSNRVEYATTAKADSLYLIIECAGFGDGGFSPRK